MHTMSYRRKRFLFAPLFLVVLAIVSTITMLLWNALMPEIFHLTEITFWQAVGLLLLARLFFGGFRPHRSWPGHTWRNKLMEKVAGMTPEERDHYFRRIHGYHHRRWSDDFDRKNEQSETNKAE